MQASDTIASRYAKMEAIRASYLARAKESAELTLPVIGQVLSDSKNSKIRTTFQGIGSRGVNNLSSKLLLALLPPNAPFFRLQVDILELEKEQREDLKTEIEIALSKIERAVMREIEVSGDRVVIFETIKHLIVTGNALLYVDRSGTRLFHLNRFVIRRDAMGNPIEIITKESVAAEALPKEVREALEKNQQYQAGKAREQDIDVYTRVTRTDDGWTWVQEAFGARLPGTDGNARLDACPWIALRFNRVDGEDYGRSYVEEYLGDLRSLETLTQAIVEGSAAAAKVLILVDPNGTTRAKTLEESPNGAIRAGNANDVTILQMNKFADFRVALDTMNGIELRLQQAFLLQSSIIRDAERVTAEEIRFMAGELEAALGGVYSILSQEFQLPYVRRRLALLTRQGLIPKLPPKLVSPSIVTGLEALGRGRDRSKLLEFLTAIAQALGPQALQMYIHVDEVIDRLALSDGIDPEGLIKSPDEIAAEQQQQQAQQLVQQLGPNAISALGGIAQQSLGTGGQPDG